MGTWTIIAIIIAALLLAAIVARHYFDLPPLKNPAKQVFHDEYEKDFLLTSLKASKAAKQKTEEKDFDDDKIKAIATAILDIRKFEIDLYWKRATYFWAFIALTYAAFGALAMEKPPEAGSNIEFPPAKLTWFVVCFGLFLSVAWHLVNKGSKYWQENWENHLDLIEDRYIGPLYKTVVSRRRRKWWHVFGYLEDIVNGPAPFSVSKVNACLSFFNILVWSYIAVRLFLADQKIKLDDSTENYWIISVTLIVILFMIFLSATNRSNRPTLRATKRAVRISLQ